MVFSIFHVSHNLADFSDGLSLLVVVHDALGSVPLEHRSSVVYLLEFTLVDTFEKFFSFSFSFSF